MSEKSAKADRHRRIVLTGIELTMENGQVFNIDPKKVQIVDRETHKPLFDEVMEAQPPMEQPSVEVVQNGNWTGIKVNKKGKQ
jgi:hypothetical protein